MRASQKGAKDVATKQRRAPKGGCIVNGKRYAGGQFLPAHGEAIPLVDALAEELIRRVESTELAPDRDAALALRRVMRGSRAQRDLRVLDRRRRQAVAMLADQGPDVLRPYWRAVLAAMPER